MNKLITVILISLFAPFLASGADLTQPLIVDVPPNWVVSYKGDNRTRFYTVKREGGDTALMMLSIWPVPGNISQIPEVIESMAKGFIVHAEKSKKFELLTTNYIVEEIHGDVFSGNFVQFSIKGGILQTMFMIGDKDVIWNGQFTGTKERWIEAVDILKKIKKNG